MTQRQSQEKTYISFYYTTFKILFNLYIYSPHILCYNQSITKGIMFSNFLGVILWQNIL